MKKYLGRVGFAVCILAAIQLLRMGGKMLLFQFAEHTLMADTIYSLIFMLLCSMVMVLLAQKKHPEVNLFPKKISKPYVVFSVLVLLLFLVTPFITLSTTVYDWLFLLYGALITPIFEELIFRAYLWKYFSFTKEPVTYITVTFLFGIWHLGYIDTILWRTSLFHPDANIPEIHVLESDNRPSFWYSAWCNAIQVQKCICIILASLCAKYFWRISFIP